MKIREANMKADYTKVKASVDKVLGKFSFLSSSTFSVFIIIFHEAKFYLEDFLQPLRYYAEKSGCMMQVSLELDVSSCEIRMIGEDRSTKEEAITNVYHYQKMFLNP